MQANKIAAAGIDIAMPEPRYGTPLGWHCGWQLYEITCTRLEFQLAAQLPPPRHIRNEGYRTKLHPGTRVNRFSRSAALTDVPNYHVV